MKITASLLYFGSVLLITSNIYAQSPPNISYKDCGYSKLVKKVTKMYYSIDYGRDGGMKNLEEVEKVTQIFNTEGNIESYECQSLLDNTWAKSQTIYKNERLGKEIWTHSNPYLNRIHTYNYDKQGRIAEEKIRLKDGSKSHIKFKYEGSVLIETEAYICGIQYIKERFYTANGKLYKETHRQEVPNEADILTHYYYLEDKEILSFVAPQSYFYATAYLKDATDTIEIKFKLIEDSAIQNKLLKGIQRFEKEAHNDNLPFNLQKYSEQTLQAYEKNKKELKPYRIVMYLRDENNNIEAEAEVDLKTKNIASIGFFQTELPDGTIIGTTEFLHKKMHLFEAMLEQAKLP
ncbi:hypothetical protein [Confluentibacter sediminis]|uniref:hypothetical protein n=1 Tax=Confluentibacter sediminis TaxID=2219045 RepID=UPI000DAE7327|nr:hypothetical protein [Confluentibacter sediminis]